MNNFDKDDKKIDQNEKRVNVDMNIINQTKKRINILHIKTDIKT